MRKMYSTNQIINTVNKGIESGQVEIPAGGTQLYKHVATGKLNVQGDIYTFRFTFITTRKTSLVGVSIDTFSNFISGTAALRDGEYLAPGIIASMGEYNICIYVPTWEQIASNMVADEENPNFLTDTVTEL